MEQRKRLVVLLPDNDYRLLGQLAEREERTADQQASFLLRCRLAELAREQPTREAKRACR